MDTLHSVMRTIRGETKSRRDHLSVFRDFISQLDRIGRRQGRGGGKGKGGKRGRRGK